MANSLNEELTGKRVVFHGVKPAYENMSALVTGGFGAHTFTHGTALFVIFENGTDCRMDAETVRAIVPNVPGDEELLKQHS